MTYASMLLTGQQRVSQPLTEADCNTF